MNADRVGTLDRRIGGAVILLACALALLLSAALAEQAEAASKKILTGKAVSGNLSLSKLPVKVYRAGGSNSKPKLLGNGTTKQNGHFRLSFREPSSSNAVLYVTAGRKSAIQVAATLGAPPVANDIVINEMTTVATGYAFAQFIRGRSIAGPRPGPQNAALMARNLANPVTGGRTGVLRKSPNGSDTSTLQTFNSLANMLPACARSTDDCSKLFRLAARPNGTRPKGTLQAISNIARSPWQNVTKLFNLAAEKPHPYGNPLASSEGLAHWMLPLRFVGDGMSMDGPGNFAIDGDGNIYVANNYEYGADPLIPRCGSDLLPKFGPDGRYTEDSPFQGGGLSGAGYGITLDPDGNLWVGNFGFAAPAPGCPESKQPPHNSVSKFTPDGTALSGDDGYVVGDLFWPQGTVSDQEGSIWVANCGNGLVTRMPAGDPSAAVGLDVGLEEAFDIAINGQGVAYATGLGNSKLAILNPDGTPRSGSPLGAAALGLNRPMGIASDSQGNMWIANSGLVNLPCPDATIDFSNTGGSVSLLGNDGVPVTVGVDGGFRGGGMTIPWGIAVDGDDNVWVANFQSQRISQICGVPAKRCRPGSETGDPISPDGTGYYFDGMVRTTAVQIDPSGNVWSANNWKNLPIQTNPGGYEVIAWVGAAAPLKTPLIGPPVPLLG